MDSTMQAVQMGLSMQAVANGFHNAGRGKWV